MTARLACFDLDNTLIDRDGAFLAWARWWVDRSGLGADAVEWLVAHDNGGFTPRAQLFAGAREAFGVVTSVEELVAAYDREHPGFTWVEPAVLDGLASLSTAGWRVAVVTNGNVVQQSRKLEHTGIAGAVDYCCISEAAGVRKPDARIFAIAAEGAGATLADGWMVGDHPPYDIAGGINAKLSTIRIGDHHDVPTPIADHHLMSVVDAFPVILAS
ncbi:putative hydrolase of the HAD superfamily [Kribbella steppae]|uniref:Putative hydrolase of the HAD superfamily n=1 Tax=Kribbella steppae TaxID=2512223 RepID=A0A4R2H4X9_9ACTN|nr:HAD family hydrolase [Kribbella steppae]TCO20537.1 putative hydrolase of the HAD superfamily [Kribbella steppae]